MNNDEYGEVKKSFILWLALRFSGLPDHHIMSLWNHTTRRFFLQVLKCFQNLEGHNIAKIQKQQNIRSNFSRLYGVYNSAFRDALY